MNPPTLFAGIEDGGLGLGAVFFFFLAMPCCIITVLVFLLAISFVHVTKKMERKPGEKS